jgi:uncharacterized protein (TIGR00251 family)
MLRIIVHVKPGSRENSVYRDSSGNIQVRLTARPVKGEANEALIKFLSGFFRIRQNQIHIEKGIRGRNKTLLFHVADEDAEQIESRIKPLQSRS